MEEIRQAVVTDIETIISFDEVAWVEASRRDFIQNSVQSDNAWVAILNDRVVGYAVLEYTFFSQGFMSMLYVHKNYRRRGIGSTLVRYIESICTRDKLFTSTNESNQPMQALMAKLGYAPSGVVNNLDENDPEIIYFKRITR